MKVVLAPVGTRGDVQPMIALGRELRRRGHDVVVCCAVNFRGFVEGHGLVFAEGGRDAQTLVLEAGERLDDLRKMLPLTRLLVAEQFALVDAACDGADVVIGTPLCVASVVAAEQRNVPFAWATFFPAAWPSSDQPPPVFPSAPAFLNRPLWWLYKLLSEKTLAGIIGGERSKRGLPPGRIFDIAAQHHALAAFDDIVGTAPQGWPSPHTLTGTWFLDDDIELPDSVEEFLAAGAAPVFIGFGSMPHDDVEARSAVIDDALKNVGVRAIVGRGWQKLKTSSSSSVLVVDNVDHRKLFPRCAAVVHHAGAGTTAQAARAGVPQVVVPHMFDQHYWAARVHALGVAPAPLSTSFSSSALAQALTQALSEPTKTQAQKLALRVRETRGVQVAADWVEASRQ